MIQSTNQLNTLIAAEDKILERILSAAVIIMFNGFMGYGIDKGL